MTAIDWYVCVCEGERERGGVVDVCHHILGEDMLMLTMCLCLLLMVVTPACLRLWREDNMAAHAV